MVEIPVVAGASAPSSGSRSKGTPAAIDGDDASPRDPAPTTRDDAPAVVDPTGAGVVDWRAFTHGMRSLGLDYSTDELTQIMKEFDANCDGHIDWVEFVGHLMPRESDDVAAEFERLSMARKAMLRSKGISRAGDGTPGVRASRPRWE